MSTGFRRDGKTDDRLLEAYRIALGQWRESVRLAAHVSGRPHLAIIETRTQYNVFNHLRIVFPTDFPSWWVPGGTTLCVYLPAEEERMSVNE